MDIDIVDQITENVERSFDIVTSVESYNVLSELGRGAFGSVFLVEHSSNSKKLLAMKALNTQIKNKKVINNRFNIANKDTPEQEILKEIKIMKKLDHPNLVKLEAVYHEKEDPKMIFIIMEYATFGPIMRKIDNPNQPHPSYICNLTGTIMGEALASRSFRGVLSGIAYMHNKKIAHRKYSIQIDLIHLRLISLFEFG